MSYTDIIKHFEDIYSISSFTAIISNIITVNVMCCRFVQALDTK